MSVESSKRKKSNPLAAGISGAILGGISGGLIGYSFAQAKGALVGAIVGALYFGIVEAVTDIRREPAALKPLWHRIIGSALVGAALAAVLAFFIDNDLLLALLMGGLVGLAGLGVQKLLLGLLVGLGVGIVAVSASGDPNAALIGGSVVLIYRLLMQLFFRGSGPLQFTGEHVPVTDARFVVPFEAHTKYVGAKYMEELARESDGSFQRNQPDIGIVSSFVDLRGPTFDPERVAPLIREFYEHTTRFKLSIVPKWNPLVRPFFWFSKPSLPKIWARLICPLIPKRPNEEWSVTSIPLIMGREILPQRILPRRILQRWIPPPISSVCVVGSEPMKIQVKRYMLAFTQSCAMMKSDSSASVFPYRKPTSRPH